MGVPWNFRANYWQRQKEKKIQNKQTKIPFHQNTSPCNPHRIVEIPSWAQVNIQLRIHHYGELWKMKTHFLLHLKTSSKLGIVVKNMFQLIFHLGSSGKRWQMDTISHRLRNPTSLAFQAPQLHGCALLITLQHLGDQVCVRLQLLSHVWLFETPWTVACQAPLSMEFSRQEYWSSCHFFLQGEQSPHANSQLSFWWK